MHVTLERALGRRLPLAGFRLDMTLRDLTARLGDIPGATSDVSEAPQRPQVFIFAAARGIELNTLEFRDEKVSDIDVVLVDHPFDYKRAPYTIPIEELARELLPEVRRQLQTDRRLVLLGQWCGASVAHEIGTILESEGITVDLLVITDIPRSHDWMQILRANPIRALKSWTKLQMAHFMPKPWLLKARKWYESRENPTRLQRRIRAHTEDFLSRQHSYRWRPKILRAQSLLLLSVDLLRHNPRIPIDLGWSTVCSSLGVAPMGVGHVDYTRRPISPMVKSLILTSLPKSPREGSEEPQPGAGLTQ